MMRIDLIMRAAVVAATEHAGQVDRAGAPYILHPLAVATDVAKQGYSDEYIITALLHDTIEDTSLTLEDISNMFPEPLNQDIIRALELLTHDKSEPYLDYIGKIKNDQIAKVVKRADLRHNMDLSRLPDITEKDLQRKKKYETAYSLLEQ